MKNLNFQLSLRIVFEKSSQLALMTAGIFVLTACATQNEVALRPFVSDGCSMSPDLDFGDCCFVHDYRYWKGGTKEERRIADRELRQCINEKRRGFGFIYYSATRLFGTDKLPTSFRWGFGWVRKRSAEGINQMDRSRRVEELTSSYIRDRKFDCRSRSDEYCKPIVLLCAIFHPKLEECEKDSLIR